MIDDLKEFATFTNENGEEVPIQVIREFEREEDSKKFVIYTDIEDKENFEDRQFYVAEIVTCEDGSEELAEIEDEKDLAYCQDMFDSIVEELLSQDMSDLEDEEEENVIVS